jgi:O-antigen biosynthesis protein
MFHNVAEYDRLYPDDPGPAWHFCAPRMEPASAALVAIRARLLARTGSSESFGPPEMLQGSIDRCDRKWMGGWAFDPAQPTQRVRLEIRCDGEVAGHVVAGLHRRDLEQTGRLGDGHCAFNFLHPIQLSPLASHVIELVRAADGAPLPGSPVHLPAASRFDPACLGGVAQVLHDAAQAAVTASDLDAIIVHQMTQIEALLAARARLDAGPRAEVADLRARWGGIVPATAVRRSAPQLRPRALFIDDLFPAPGLNGGASAALDHMRSLMRIGFDVSFVATRDLGDSRGKAEVLSALGIRSLLAPWYGSVEEVLRRNAGRIDVVYLHRVGNATSYGKLVRRFCPRAQVVYGIADLHYVRMARQGTVEDRPELTRHSKHLQLDELIAARWADVVITHSGAEATLLRAQLPGVTVTVVPWSVPVPRPNRGWAERDGIVFVGTFGHDPNIDAVHWLAREILPLVERQAPEIGFRIVGNEMSAALRRLARPGLVMLGPVERLDSVLDGARLTVAPLRYGAGLKAKVIESLAAGVPCVGTSIAFEGMALPPALANCVADTPEAIAAALIRLYRDEREHSSAAEAGRHHVLVHYSESCVDSRMRDALAPALRRWAGVLENVA